MNSNLKTVVLIDDQQANNFLTEMVLEDAECSAAIKAYLSAEDALEDLKEHGATPDLIFLDINMPGMDGWQFLDAYEQNLDTSNSSVIVMLTSSDNEDDIKKAKSYACVKDYVTKPLTEEYCRMIVEKFPELASKILGAQKS